MTKEEAFARYCEIFDFAEVGKKIEEIVDVNEFINTPAAPSIETGVAYEGGVIFHTIMVYHFAKKLQPILRSSYEFEYARQLDSSKIYYEVESLRIKYYNIYSCHQQFSCFLSYIIIK